MSTVPKNPPPLPAGMDNPWYDYAPYPKRPKFNWPRNARVAFYVVLHLEYYELLPPEGIVKDSRFTGEFGTYHPDYRTWTQREYGNRTGIFRVLDVLDRYQIRAGVAVNAMAAERYPFLMEQFRKRNYEIIGHGVSANRMISSKMSEAEEKQEIATLDRRDREGDRRGAQGLARPGIWREPAHAEAAGRCWPRLRSRLAQRRPALSDACRRRKEVRLAAQPAGMGRRAAALAAAHQHRALPPTSWATPSSCCITRAARCSTCRSIPG